MKNWIMKIVISFLLLISFAAAVEATGAPAIVNPGFENPSVLPWTAFPGSGGIAFATTLTDHSGIKSLRIENFGVFDYTAMRQFVIVHPRNTYKISGWIKTDLYRGKCQLDLYSSSLFDSEGTKSLYGKNSWTYVSEEVKIPSGITTAQFRLIMDRDPNGTCWFDDLAIEDITPATDNKPAVTLSVSPSSGNEPLDVEFNIECSDDDEDDSSTSYCKIKFGTTVEIIGGDVRSSDIGDDVSYYVWNESNDGAWGEKSIEVRYDNSGTYSAYAIVNDNAGQAITSSSKTITVNETAEAPAVPTGLTVSLSSSTDTTPYLSWNKSEGAESYEIQRKTGSSGSWADIASVTATSYGDASLADGTYYYKVRASANGLSSSYSSSVSVTISSATDEAPTATIDASPNSGNAPLDVTFYVECSDDEEDSSSTSYCKIKFGTSVEILDGDVRSSDIGDIVSYYIWNSSNDGTWGSKDIRVQYDNTGTFSASISVRDNAWQTSVTEVETIIVEEGNPSNAVPAISGIPDVTLQKNSGYNSKAVDLWDYASDAEDSDSELSFSILSESNSSLVDCSISSDRYVDCDVENSTGTSTVVVEVEDQDGAADTDTFIVNVVETNESSPVFSGINDFTFTENQSAPGNIFRIEDYVSDEDTSDSQLEFTFSQTNSSLISCSIIESGSYRYFNCDGPKADTTGTSQITLFAEDPEGNDDSTTFDITVESEAQQGNTPAWSSISNIELEENQDAETRMIDLWDRISDGDTSDNKIDFSISQSNSSLISCYLEDDAGYERWFSCTAPKDDTVGTNTIIITARDPEGHTASITFDVKVVSDNDNDGVCSEIDLDVDDVRVDEGRTKTIFIDVRNRSNEDFEIDNVNLVGSGPFEIRVVNDDELEGEVIDAGDIVTLEIEIDADNVGSSESSTINIEIEGDFEEGDTCRRDDATAELDITVVDDEDDVVCSDMIIDDSDLVIDENDNRTFRIEVENDSEDDFRITGIEVIENASFFSADEGSFSSSIDAGETGYVEVEIDSDSVSYDRTDDITVRIRGSFDNGESCSSGDIEERIDVTVDNDGNGVDDDNDNDETGDFSVDIKTSSIELERGQSKTVTVEITNNMNSTECFDVTLDRSSTTITAAIDDDEFCIGKDAEKELKLKATAGSSASFADYEIDVEVENDGRTNTETLDVEVVSSSSSSTSTSTTSSAPDTSTVYDIEVRGVPSTIELSGNTSKEFTITLENPTKQGFTNLVISMKNLPEGVFFEQIVRSKLNPKETITVTGRIESASPAAASFTAPLEISTDQGNIVKNVRLDVQAPEESQGAAASGFASLLGTIGIGALMLIALIVVIVIIVVLVRR